MKAKTTKSKKNVSVKKISKTEKLAKSAPRIIQEAASILEEEVAAGIVAAKKIEKRYINVVKIRIEKPNQVLKRFRKDAHEVVDILVDMINVGTNYLNAIAEQKSKSTTKKPGKSAKKS